MITNDSLFKVKIIFCALSFFAVSAQSIENLSLDQYIAMARDRDASAKSSEMSLKGTQKILKNADLITGLNFFASGSYMSDARPTLNPTFQGDKTNNNSYALGIQQQTAWGLAWSVSQNYSYTKINNASLISTPEYYDAYPKFELSMPLWRNWLGAETKANKEQIESQLSVQKINSELNQIQKDNEIKDAYYNLLTQQKNYEIQKDSLQRAEKILVWADSRFKRNLTDKSDVFQTQALVSARQIDLINADNKLKESKRIFNSFLNLDSDQVEFKLVDEEINLSKLALKKKEAKVRVDLALQKENIKSLESGFLFQKEKNKPNLNLAVSYLKQGRDIDGYSSAQNNITNKDKDYYLVALQFSMPLDLSNLADSKEGYSLLAQSQALAEKARVKNEVIQWQNVADQAEALVSQLKIIRELENIQKNKADLERTKYNNGRSTTYQVLNFEQDYINSRNQRVNTELQIRRFINSLDLYK